MVTDYQIEKIFFQRNLGNVVMVLSNKFIFIIGAEIRYILVFIQQFVNASRRGKMKHFSLE